ncbi:MAG: hypothetical protein KDA66_01915 [Planctomycetaceae bacterium]|nr:hypothetical protein [Planctomycetaceae bacterium]
MPSRCPSDCVFPELHWSRFRWNEDILPLLCLKRPYRCASCGHRFHATSRALVAFVALAAFLVCYPLSYHQVASQYESNPTVQTIYQPLIWVEEQLMSSTSSDELPAG